MSEEIVDEIWSEAWWEQKKKIWEIEDEQDVLTE